MRFEQRKHERIDSDASLAYPFSILPTNASTEPTAAPCPVQVTRLAPAAVATQKLLTDILLHAPREFTAVHVGGRITLLRTFFRTPCHPEHTRNTSPATEILRSFFEHLRILLCCVRISRPQRCKR